MKIKRLQILRPEFEVDFNPSVFIRHSYALCKFVAKLYFAFVVFPQLIKVKRAKVNIEIKSPFHKYAGTVYKHNVWFICIPKIKVVKSE